MSEPGELRWSFPKEYQRADVRQPKHFFICAISAICMFLGAMVIIPARNPWMESAQVFQHSVNWAFVVGGSIFLVGLLMYIVPPPQELKLDSKGVHASLGNMESRIAFERILGYAFRPARVRHATPALVLRRKGRLGFANDQYFPLGKEVSQEQIDAWMKANHIPYIDEQDPSSIDASAADS